MRNVLELQQSDFTEREREGGRERERKGGREREREREGERERGREGEVINWVTFIYVCAYVSIASVH